MSTTTWWEEPSVTDSNKQYLDSAFIRKPKTGQKKSVQERISKAQSLTPNPISCIWKVAWAKTK